MERFSSSAELAAVGPVLAGEVMGHALFRMRPGDVPGFARSQGRFRTGWTRVPPSLLRYADEQTIAGTAAVFTAIEAMGASPDRFEAWGVVAATRYLGRANLAVALRSFMAEGVWGTSPHLIPHFALHSASGSISLALGSHGPNLGVGGGLHAVAEGFLTALTWLSTGVGAGRVARLERLVAGAGSRPGWKYAPRRRMPGPGRGPGGCRGRGRLAGRCGLFSDRIAATRAIRSPDLASLAERLGGRESRSPQTIATDASGRLRIELVDGSDFPG